MTGMVRILPKIEETSSSAEKRDSTPLASRDRLCRRLERGPEARAKFVESHINKGLAYQLRAMREARGWSQEELAELVDMPQTAISRLESPDYGKPTITTLKRVAKVHDVALVVRFVPFSKLVNWVSGTPYLENGLSSDALAVPSFEEEANCGEFDQVVNTAIPVLRADIPIVNSVSYGTAPGFFGVAEPVAFDESIMGWATIKSGVIFGNLETGVGLINPMNVFPPETKSTPESKKIIQYQQPEFKSAYAC